MTDDYRYPDTGDEARPEPTRRTPRWLAAVGICIAIVLLVLVAVLHLTGVVGPR